MIVTAGDKLQIMVFLWLSLANCCQFQRWSGSGDHCERTRDRINCSSFRNHFDYYRIVDHGFYNYTTAMNTKSTKVTAVPIYLPSIESKLAELSRYLANWLLRYSHLYATGRLGQKNSTRMLATISPTGIAMALWLIILILRIQAD